MTRCISSRSSTPSRSITERGILVRVTSSLTSASYMRSRSPGWPRGQRSPEMQWIPEILQLSIVVDRVWSPPFEFLLSQKCDFVPGNASAQRGVLQELGQPRLVIDGIVKRPLDEIQLLHVPRHKPVVQHDFHPKGGKVDIPGLKQRVQVRDTVLR